MEVGMFRTKSHKQGTLLDPWAHEMGPSRFKLLENSWAKLFHDEILPVLPAQKLAAQYHKSFGRPTKEMSAVLGAIQLQQTHDLTDEQTVEAYAFNQLWHYALEITSSSDDGAYLCGKTLWTVRQHVMALGLDEAMFNDTTARLAEAFGVDTSKQRLDSVHIKSNMRKLGRIGLFARVLHKFLVNLRRQHPTKQAELDPELVARYLPEKALSCFSRVKPTEADRALSALARDLHELLVRFAGDDTVTAMHSYKLMQRVENEQCLLVEDESGELIEVRARPAKEVQSDSLQNPSDPDASYSGHKGQGYHVQISETYTEQPAVTSPVQNGPAETTPQVPQLNLITGVTVERAHESDANALLPMIDSLRERGLGPTQMLADTLYGGEENRIEAQGRGVELISPASGTVANDGGLTLASFKTTEKGDVQECPQGQIPLKTKKGKHGRHSAVFAAAACAQCPLRDQCPTCDGSNGQRRYLRYTEKELHLAKRRAYENTPAFIEKYAKRSGVEGTMSQYDRRTGVKKLRVRELPAVTLSARLKAIGVNILRATAVRRARQAVAAATGIVLNALDGAAVAPEGAIGCMA
jgi:hypothetical protein